MAIPRAIVTSEEPDALQVQIGWSNLGGAIFHRTCQLQQRSAETLYSHIYQSLLKLMLGLMGSLVCNSFVIVLPS